LQFGNMYPSSQKEDELLEQVESLNERLMEEQNAGTSPEELLPMREQLQQLTSHL